MTNSDYTAIALLMDRSGSMITIRDDAEGGIRTFIDEQRKGPGKCTLRVSSFDYRLEQVYASTPIESAPYPELVPRGGTALLDAWGQLIGEFGEELASLPEDDRPANVIFVVVTDGEENSSKEWTKDQLFAKVKEQTDTYGWTFLFLAANQDAVSVGRGYGVPQANSMDFSLTSKGVAATYAASSASVLRTRTGQGTGFTEAERSAALTH